MYKDCNENLQMPKKKKIRNGGNRRYPMDPPWIRDIHMNIVRENSDNGNYMHININRKIYNYYSSKNRKHYKII